MDQPESNRPTTRTEPIKWYRNACPVCHSDLHDSHEDTGWVECIGCALTFKVADIELPPPDPSNR